MNDSFERDCLTGSGTGNKNGTPTDWEWDCPIYQLSPNVIE